MRFQRKISVRRLNPIVGRGIAHESSELGSTGVAAYVLDERIGVHQVELPAPYLGWGLTCVADDGGDPWVFDVALIGEVDQRYVGGSDLGRSPGERRAAQVEHPHGFPGLEVLAEQGPSLRPGARRE